MSRKNVLIPHKLVNAADMSGVIVSDPVSVRYGDNVGLQVSYTGTPTGTFAVESTIDGQEWISLSFSPALTAPAGAPGAFLISLNQVPYDQIRLRYTPSAGAGALTVHVEHKSLGA